MLRPLFSLLALILLGAAPGALATPAAEPTLTIRAASKTVVYKRSALLARPDVVTLVVPRDPAYERPMTYRAVAATALFKDIPVAASATLQFRCLDGFSAPIAKDRLLSRSSHGARAFIAIEPPHHPWPKLRADRPSAGPFYLVWSKPELSRISQEEWPYQLAGFEVKADVASLYPKIVPGKEVAADSPVRRGFAVFTKNCFACHTLNKSGTGQVGPDLNVPMSPTEYFAPGILRRLVRDQQKVRYFPRSTMSRFPPEVISNRELDDLVAYLGYMAKHKQP